jgi:hypothetical protein
MDRDYSHRRPSRDYIYESSPSSQSLSTEPTTTRLTSVKMSLTESDRAAIDARIQGYLNALGQQINARLESEYR